MLESMNSQLAVIVGYLGAMGVWVVVSRRWPNTWIARPRTPFERPGVELAWALVAVVGVIVLSVLFSSGFRLPMPEEAGLLRDIAFLLNLAVIWSPVLLLMAWRRHGLETCLMPGGGLGRRLSWGAGMALLGAVLYVVVVADVSLVDLPRVAGEMRWTTVVQGLIQFFGFGFLLYRVAAVTGWAMAGTLVGVLYGLVKFPYYVGQLGMGWGEAGGLIALAILIAAVGLNVVGRQGDLLAPALLHTLMDAAQKL